jgi:predicted membrane chloride channel (bestrophin family)
MVNDVASCQTATSATLPTAYSLCIRKDITVLYSELTPTKGDR